MTERPTILIVDDEDGIVELMRDWHSSHRRVHVIDINKDICRRLNSHHRTSHSVHGSFHVSSDLEPVCSSLGKFLYFFGSEYSVESIVVGDN